MFGKKVHEEFVAREIINKEYLPKEYKYFGNDNIRENLSLFLKNNAFFASSLVLKKDENTGARYFAITTQNPQEGEVSFFSKLVNTLDKKLYILVNATFDENMNLQSTSCYKDNVLVEKSDEEACGYLAVLLAFYSECVHATIHIFHYLLITGLADSVQHSDLMNKWATPYYENVSLKFIEVKELLFAEDGALTGGTFKANRNEVMKVCKEFFVLWGACKSAKDFTEEFLFRGMIKHAKNGIASLGVLEEFLKHVDLCNGYATEISAEFDLLKNGKDLGDCNKNLRLYFENCGANVTSKVDNLVTWTELMCVTGFLHSNTLSFGRLILTPPVSSKFTLSDTYGAEVGFMFGTAGTIVGVNYDKHVFSDQMYPKGTLVLGLREIITKYAARCDKLKNDYWKKISKLPHFNDYGWILTDYCPDGLDGKSMTLTTYI